MDANALERRGRAALAIRRCQLALDDADRALAIDAHHAGALTLRAQALDGLNRFAEALEAAESAVKSRPDSEWIHRIRARLFVQLGRYDDALVASDRAVHLAPGQPLAHLSRAYSLRALARQDEAVLAAEEALRLGPECVETEHLLGSLFLEKDAARAERHFRAALRMDPRYAASLNNLGATLARQGRLWESILTFKRAVEADPSSDLAKQNAYRSLRAWTGSTPGNHREIPSSLRSGPSGEMIAMYGVIGAIVVLSIAIEPRWFGYAAGGIAAIAAAIHFARWSNRRSRLRKLQERDPELLAMFEQIESDRRNEHD